MTLAAVLAAVALVGFVASSVLIAMHLVLFARRPKRNTLADMNLVGLAVGYLMTYAPAAYLTGSGLSAGGSRRSYAEDALQYGFMATRWWMTALAAEVWVVWSLANRNAWSSDGRRSPALWFAAYSAIAWLTPAPLVYIYSQQANRPVADSLVVVQLVTLLVSAARASWIVFVTGPPPAADRTPFYAQYVEHLRVFSALAFLFVVPSVSDLTASTEVGGSLSMVFIAVQGAALFVLADWSRLRG